MSDRFDQETLRLGLLLRSLAKTRERSIRSLEQKMGVSDGIFYKVLNGKITMQMRHLLMIVDALEMTPAEFFEVAYPKTTLPASTSQKDLQEAREDEDADLEGKVRRVLLQIIGGAGGDSKPGPKDSSH
jgi:transcriptional regulator with XRE-family HTH domain